MEARAVDYVRYPVSDLGTSIPFYRDTLGLTLEKHVEEVGWAEFALPPTTIALDEVGTVDPDGSGEAGAGVALAVDDVETAVAELRDEGVPVVQEPIDTGVCEKAKIRDPDGNLVVLHRRQDGSRGRMNPFP